VVGVREKGERRTAGIVAVELGGVVVAEVGVIVLFVDVLQRGHAQSLLDERIKLQQFPPRSGTPCMQVAGAAELEHVVTAQHNRMEHPRQDLAAGMPTSTVSTCSSASARVMASRCRTKLSLRARSDAQQKLMQVRLVYLSSIETGTVAPSLRRPCMNIMPAAQRC